MNVRTLRGRGRELVDRLDCFYFLHVLVAAGSQEPEMSSFSTPNSTSSAASPNPTVLPNSGYHLSDHLNGVEFDGAENAGYDDFEIDDDAATPRIPITSTTPIVTPVDPGSITMGRESPMVACFALQI